MADLEQEPKFCGTCGSKLRRRYKSTFDEQTGKEIVDPKYWLVCKSDYCIMMYHPHVLLCESGTKQVWRKRPSV